MFFEHGFDMGIWYENFKYVSFQRVFFIHIFQKDVPVVSELCRYIQTKSLHKKKQQPKAYQNVSFMYREYKGKTTDQAADLWSLFKRPE